MLLGHDGAVVAAAAYAVDGLLGVDVVDGDHARSHGSGEDEPEEVVGQVGRFEELLGLADEAPVADAEGDLEAEVGEEKGRADDAERPAERGDAVDDAHEELGHPHGHVEELHVGGSTGVRGWRGWKKGGKKEGMNVGYTTAPLDMMDN